MYIYIYIHRYNKLKSVTRSCSWNTPAAAVAVDPSRVPGDELMLVNPKRVDSTVGLSASKSGGTALHLLAILCVDLPLHRPENDLNIFQKSNKSVPEVAIDS